MTPDKRDECGCHRECTNLPHECEKPCRWPACLTAAEEAELLERIQRDEVEWCGKPMPAAELDDMIHSIRPPWEKRGNRLSHGVSALVRVEHAVSRLVTRWRR